MNKKDVIYYINSLGFHDLSLLDGLSRVPLDKSLTCFNFDENLSIIIEEKLDYYTSYYGNHPIKYNVKFIWFNEILVECSIEELTTPIVLVDTIDRMMGVYRGSAVHSIAWNKFNSYERYKNPVLKSIKRDLQIQVLLEYTEGLLKEKVSDGVK